MRAQHLGSTAVTIRVRCACGKKSDLYRYFWQRRGYVICDHCKGFILYHSLEVKEPSWQGCVIADSQPAAGELEAYRLVESELRSFLELYDAQPEWLWAPQTSRMVESVRPLLARLEELRRQEAAPGERAA